MPKLKDISGQRFGRLLVKSYSHRVKSVHYWTCICDCGKERQINRASLKNGRTKSCGCLENESRKTHRLTHGQSYNELWRRWKSMIHRCEYPATVGYKSYGGRGITVSEEWHDFDNFRRDMGPSFSENLTLERIDNEKGYSKENCRWATWSEQSNNRSTTRKFTMNGATKSISEWAKHFSMSYTMLRNRLIKIGMTIEMATSTPSRRAPNISQRQNTW